MQIKLNKLLKPYPIIPPPISSGSAYYFTTDSGVHYEVRFGRKQNNILNTSIVFGVLNEEYEGEEYSSTNRFEVFRVMATIVKIVRKYMTIHPKINSYEFTGEPRKERLSKDGKVKMNLYRRYLPYVFDNNWEVNTIMEKTVIRRKTSLA